MAGVLLFVRIALYLLAARFILFGLKGAAREVAFALLNVAGYYFIFVYGQDFRFTIAFLLYLPIVLGLYLCMSAFSRAEGATPWIAFFAPILVLLLIRHIPVNHFDSALRLVHTNFDFTALGYLLGFSYLAFRCSHLVLEVRNGVVPQPTFWQYIGYCFFVPTMSVGPINSYSNYRRGFESEPLFFPLETAFLRVVVGFVKYLFFGSIFNQLSYSGLLLDGHQHPWIDLPIAAVCYYLYLYCNFSGFCDLAIGGAALIGIPVTENFNDPLYSRNMREFWNRWHITLSQYMRDVCFQPVSKYLARRFGPNHINHSIALTVMIVFILMGIWHGTGWNYVVFGVLQGMGVITTHYYSLGLKKWLGREGYKAYNSNRWIHAAAIAVTFCYYSATLFFFANTPSEMKEIFSVIR